MNNIIYKLNNQTLYKDITIRAGDAIIFIVELDQEAIDMTYACAGNLHGNVYEFQKKLNDGIVHLGENKYKVTVDSIDTQNMIQGVYNHNLSVEIDGGVYTILSGLVFVESSNGKVNYVEKIPNMMNYNSYIDGTITEAILTNVNEVPTFMFFACEHLKNVIIFSTITSIEKSAFSGCSDLPYIVLPEGLTTIDDYGFARCTNLALTSLPESLTTIGKQAFYQCTSLALTSLPVGVINISDYSFQMCTSLALTSLPNGVTYIGVGAFLGCTSLELTSIPSAVNTIADGAFNGCLKLTTLKFYGTPSSISLTTFLNCDNLTDIYVPWSEGAVANAPWGAIGATIHYNS